MKEGLSHFLSSSLKIVAALVTVASSQAVRFPFLSPNRSASQVRDTNVCLSSISALTKDAPPLSTPPFAGMKFEMVAQGDVREAMRQSAPLHRIALAFSAEPLLSFWAALPPGQNRPIQGRF